jgi:hypothetical protein
MRVRTHAVRPAGVSKRPSVCESILLGAPKILQKTARVIVAAVAAFCFKNINVGILRQFSAHTWLAASMRFANSACARGIRASLHSIASIEDPAVSKKILEHLGRQGAADWPDSHPLPPHAARFFRSTTTRLKTSSSRSRWARRMGYLPHSERSGMPRRRDSKPIDHRQTQRPRARGLA